MPSHSVAVDTSEKDFRAPSIIYSYNRTHSLDDDVSLLLPPVRSDAINFEHIRATRPCVKTLNCNEDEEEEEEDLDVYEKDMEDEGLNENDVDVTKDEGVIGPLKLAYGSRYPPDVQGSVETIKHKLLEMLEYERNIETTHFVPCCIAPIADALKLSPIPEHFLQMLSYATGLSLQELDQATNVASEANMMILPKGASNLFLDGDLTFQKENVWYGLYRDTTTTEKMKTELTFDYANQKYIELHRWAMDASDGYLRHGKIAYLKHSDEKVEDAFRYLEAGGIPPIIEGYDIPPDRSSAFFEFE
ncbi:hypothetical protein BDQ17DRAFT_1333629 [Cyathus striatus]|nr:hypothetical protein BDQ17DRAFT_1333629 [Cyathus striatus]